MRFPLTLALSFAVAAPFAQSVPPPVDPSVFNGLQWRSIGPYRGGRVTAVAGHESQPHTFYMGATGGGVWKTTDAGHSWQNVSDGFFETASIGAIEVADSDASVIYVGTGSAAIRSNVIVGRGMYRSGDAGKTWTHIGLRDAGQIGALEIHPRDPNVAFVAATGSTFGPNAERGVFRTKDGGRTWKKVLYINDKVGAVALAMNKSNPQEIYAGAWQAERKPWTILSGGPAKDTGIYKTTDGGETWTHLTTTAKGLPTGQIGKIDIDLARSKPSTVYALMEADQDQSGLYRSDDSGATWTRVSNDRRLTGRPFYYIYVDVDPKDPDTVWVNNLSLVKSTDGGKAWTTIPTPHGDNHGMWFNPSNPQIMVQSNDGGANVSLDGGKTWSTQWNQQTAELYMVETDNQFPYRVYASQQDTGAPLIVPSRSPFQGGQDDPRQLLFNGPGCETGPVKPKIDDPNIIFGVCKGEFYRMSLVTGQEQSNWVYPQNRYGHASRDIKYRMQRVTPFEMSPHDPNVIYHGSQFVHVTRNGGMDWEVISPDLTANEDDYQGISGEPITRDITGEEVYSAIYAIEESPIEKGVIWVGSNDGPVSVTRDGGRTWTRVTPKDLPAGGRVQTIDASPHRKGSAYIAVYRYLLDDFAPYIYATDDYGATWRKLTDGANGIPADSPTRVIREDPNRAHLLFAGTEFGFYVSFDNGARWQPFNLNLPVTPITDLKIHGTDLVVSTMGRGLWILDDVSRLHDAALSAAGNRLFTPSPAYRARFAASFGGPGEPEYPAAAAYIDYALAADASAGEAGEAGASGLTLEILDASGAVVRTVRGGGAAQTTQMTQEMRAPQFARRGPAPLGARAGGQRYAWDLRNDTGVLVPPGAYRVRLSAGAWTAAEPLEIRIDPRLPKDGVTQADLEQQYAFNVKLRATMADARAFTTAVETALKSATGERKATLESVRKALVTETGYAYPQPMLNDQFNSVWRVSNAADSRVNSEAIRRFDDLVAELADLKRRAGLDGTQREPAVEVVRTPTAAAAAERPAPRDLAVLLSIDGTAPVAPRVVSSQTGAGLVVDDLAWQGLDGSAVEAYLVRPEARPATCAGVLFVHWFAPPDPTSNRTQFLDEAKALARRGVVSLLPSTFWSSDARYRARTWQSDFDNSVAQAKELRRAFRLLADQPCVERSRMALVGHDYGAMFGALVAATEPMRAAVLVAGVPSFSSWYEFGTSTGVPKDDDLVAYRARLAEIAPGRAIAGFGKPVLFQFGSNDRYTPKASMDAFVAAATGRREVKTYGSGHAMTAPEIRADRTEWLLKQLGIG